MNGHTEAVHLAAQGGHADSGAAAAGSAARAEAGAAAADALEGASAAPAGPRLCPQPSPGRNRLRADRDSVSEPLPETEGPWNLRRPSSGRAATLRSQPRPRRKRLGNRFCRAPGEARHGARSRCPGRRCLVICVGRAPGRSPSRGGPNTPARNLTLTRFVFLLFCFVPLFLTDSD